MGGIIFFPQMETWHYLSSSAQHPRRTQNLQAILICSTLTNILQHNDENDEIMLIFLLQLAIIQSCSNRNWAKTEFQFNKLLGFSIFWWVTEKFSPLFSLSINQSQFLFFNTILWQTAVRTFFWKYGKTCETRTQPFFSPPNTNNKRRHKHIVNCKTITMVHNFHTHTTSAGGCLP